MTMYSLEGTASLGRIWHPCSIIPLAQREQPVVSDVSSRSTDGRPEPTSTRAAKLASLAATGVMLDELDESGIACLLELDLCPPSAGNDRRRESGIRAQDDVAL